MLAALVFRMAKKKRGPYKKTLAASGPAAKSRTKVRRKMIAEILERTRKARVEIDAVIRTGRRPSR
jgi:hypothetical protein